MKKNKNTSGGVKPALKSRTVIGIICIILALAVTVGIGPLVNKITEKTAEVVQVKRDVERGHVITEEDLEIVRVGSYNLSDKVVTDMKNAIGKYASTNLYEGQLLIVSQMTDGSNSASEVLGALDGSQLAVSVHIASFEEGLSGKLENGDVVSLLYPRTPPLYAGRHDHYERRYRLRYPDGGHGQGCQRHTVGVAHAGRAAGLL